MSSVSGRYIVIEGNDGTGKSTQVELLAESLRKRDIEPFVMHEPAGIPIADAIRTIIKNGELERTPETNLLLFTAARRELWLQASQALNRGAWVISARNYISTLVYQGIAEGISENTILELTRQFTSDAYMKPHKTIILTLNDKERAHRIAERGPLESKDTFESKDEVFQQALNDGYDAIATRFNFDTIDAAASPEVIQTKIESIIFEAAA